MNGTLYGIGVGPGDPELMTLKAVKTIARCEVVAVPRSAAENEPVALSIARQAVPGLDKKMLLELELPMVRESGALERVRAAAADAIAAQLRAGRSVAFLTIGDVSIYSTYGYLQKLVVALGFSAVMVPGVPSFCAVAARLGIPLVEAGSPLHIVPASYPGTGEALAWPGVKVLMKSGHALGEVKALLEERGASGKARLVQQCGLPGERVFESLAAADGSVHYLSTIVVGE